MKREELLKSPNYWLAYIQTGLFNVINEYKIKHKLKDKDLAGKLGVSKGYISQILNGDFDHKISKLVQLSLLCNKIPKITYLDLDELRNEESANELSDTDSSNSKPIQYILSVNSGDVFTVDKDAVKSLEGILSHQMKSDLNVRAQATEYNQISYS